MADMRIGSQPFFERGIESIVDAADTPDTPLLPHFHALAPSSLARPTALDELLRADNLESLLDAYVFPEIVERELLSPMRFRAAMQTAHAEFQRSAERRRQVNPRLGALLERAALVLRDEIELRELLQMYRNALLQG